MAILFAVLCIALGVCTARKIDSDVLMPSYDDLAEVVAAEVVKAAGSGRQLLSKPDMGRLAAVTAKRIACESASPAGPIEAVPERPPNSSLLAPSPPTRPPAPLPCPPPPPPPQLW